MAVLEVNRLGDLVKGCVNGVEFAEIPEGIIDVGDEFKGQKQLKEVIIPERMGCIAAFSFRGCESLEKVTFKADELRYISPSAFWNCKSLKEISIPPISHLCSDAFGGCDSLEEIHLARVDDIESHVFRGCPNRLGKF